MQNFDLSSLSLRICLCQSCVAFWCEVFWPNCLYFRFLRNPCYVALFFPHNTLVALVILKEFCVRLKNILIVYI